MTSPRRFGFINLVVPIPADQFQPAERVLAVARAFVSLAVLVAIRVASPTPWHDALLSYVLLGAYGAFALCAVFFLHVKPHRWTVPALMTHVVDLSIAAAVTLYSSVTNTPVVVVLLLFPLLSAAHRWGFAGTIATACAAVFLLVIEPDRLVERSTFVLLAAAVIGYLAQTEKQFQSGLSAIASIMSRADVRAGLKGTMAGVFEALLRLFHARQVVLVVYEIAADRLFLWESTRSGDGSAQAARVSRLDSRRLASFMFEPAAVAWHGVHRRGPRGERVEVLALDVSGTPLKTEPWTFPQEFLAVVEPFDRLMAVGVELGNEWKGRLFLVDPIVGADRLGALAFARRLARQIAPAVHNVYALHRVRSAAFAVERARIARELHDTVIQGVLGVQMQVAALSRRLARESPDVVAELSRLDGILQQEVVSLRELMRQMKSLDLSPDQLVDALADFVQRFQRETGIAARFVTQLDRVALAPHACQEVARILNEALINVRRHSGARNVFVRLATVNGDCRLSIDDDGRGFPFAGRMTQADLERSRKGPLVIKERVRLLGGNLTIESDPGRGARLEIALPLARHAMES